MTMDPNCPMEWFCMCGHAWWAHHPALEVACFARGCDCTINPPVKCTCKTESVPVGGEG